MEFRRCFGFCFVNGFVAINVIEFSVWLCICSVFIQPNSIDKRKKKWIHSKILWKEILIGILFVERMYFDIFFFFFALCARLYCCFFFLLCSACFEIYSCLSTIVNIGGNELKWRDKYVYPYPQSTIQIILHFDSTEWYFWINWFRLVGLVMSWYTHNNAYTLFVCFSGHVNIYVICLGKKARNDFTLAIRLPRFGFQTSRTSHSFAHKKFNHKN